MFVITKESELHHSIGSPIDGAHPGPKTDRDYRRHHFSFFPFAVSKVYEQYKGEKERWLSVGVVA